MKTIYCTVHHVEPTEWKDSQWIGDIEMSKRQNQRSFSRFIWSIKNIYFEVPAIYSNRPGKDGEILIRHTTKFTHLEWISLLIILYIEIYRLEIEFHWFSHVQNGHYSCHRSWDRINFLLTMSCNIIHHQNISIIS